MVGNVSLGDQSSPLFWLSSACSGAHFPVVEENHETGLALRLALLRVSGFLWHSSKWARQSVLGILQYTSGLEVLACSIDTNFNYYKYIPPSYPRFHNFIEKKFFNNSKKWSTAIFLRSTFLLR